MALKRELIFKEGVAKAINHRGQIESVTVVVEDFKAISVTLAVEVPHGDLLLEERELPMFLSLSHQDKHMEIGRWQRRVGFRQGLNSIENFAFPIKPELFRSGTGRYRLSVHLDDRQLWQHVFIHKTRADIRREKTDAILKSLKLAGLRMFVMRDGQSIETQVVFQTDARIALRFMIEGSGFDDDVPLIQSSLTLRLVYNGSSQTAGQSYDLCVKPGKNLYDSLGVDVMKGNFSLSPGQCTLQLVHRTQILAEVQFRILSIKEIAAHVEQCVLENLRAEDPKLCIQCGSTLYEGEYVPESAEGLLPSLTLVSSGFDSHLPRLTTNLEIWLATLRDLPKKLVEVPIILSPAPWCLSGVTIKIRGTRLASGGKHCRLVFIVKDKPVASLGFSIVTNDNILQKIEVVSLNLNAESKSGSRVGNLSKLSVTEHRSIQPSVDIRVGILAPNAVFAAALVLFEGETVLMQVNFDLSLDQATKRLDAKKTNLDSFRRSDGGAERKLTLVILVSGKKMSALSFSLVCWERMSNFEGQLKTDSAGMQFDESEYRNILDRLC